MAKLGGINLLSTWCNSIHWRQVSTVHSCHQPMTSFKLASWLGRGPLSGQVHTTIYNLVNLNTWRIGKLLLPFYSYLQPFLASKIRQRQVVASTEYQDSTYPPNTKELCALRCRLHATFQVVNCSFDHSMDVKELTSLAKQIQLAYTQVSRLGSTMLNSANLYKGYSIQGDSSVVLFVFL